MDTGSKIPLLCSQIGPLSKLLGDQYRPPYTDNDKHLQIRRQGHPIHLVLLHHLAKLERHGTNRRSGMTTKLIGEDTSIHNTKTLDTMDATLEINNAVGGSRAHARRSNWVVERECLLLHEADEIVV